MSLTNEQILSVLSLRDYPEFDHTSITRHKDTMSVSIASTIDADFNGVCAKLFEIFPDMRFDGGPSTYAHEDGVCTTELYWFRAAGEYCSLHMYHTLEKEKDSVETEPAENLTPDYTSIDEIVAREG